MGNGKEDVGPDGVGKETQGLWGLWRVGSKAQDASGVDEVLEAALGKAEVGVIKRGNHMVTLLNDHHNLWL